MRMYANWRQQRQLPKGGKNGIQHLNLQGKGILLLFIYISIPVVMYHTPTVYTNIQYMSSSVDNVQENSNRGS